MYFDPPEFRLPPLGADTLILSLMPLSHWELIRQAGEAAHQGRHDEAERFRMRAGYGGISNNERNY